MPRLTNHLIYIPKLGHSTKSHLIRGKGAGKLLLDGGKHSYGSVVPAPRVGTSQNPSLPLLLSLQIEGATRGTAHFGGCAARESASPCCMCIYFPPARSSPLRAGRSHHRHRQHRMLRWLVGGPCPGCRMRWSGGQTACYARERRLSCLRFGCCSLRAAHYYPKQLL
jgi:hypothetical protein